ncbi:MAG: HAD family hydrolase [Candidatus Jordarchaeum sp.]|uniref:HAD family hydrolase n=1 Tax=Candidatus Jordarchaeum sp. TaxID=2823881 RepID=UPI00404B023B
MIKGDSESLLKGKKAFIFDWDGTLVYFKIDIISARQDVIEILIKYGVPASILSLDQPILTMIEKSIPYIESQDDSKSKIVSMIKEIDERVEMYEMEAAQKTSLIPGVVDVLQSLKNMGLKLAVFTLNKNSVVTSLLNRMSIRSFFDVVVARDNVERPKPNPDHLKKVISLLGITAEEAIVIGDHPNDIISARSIGAKSIGVLSSGYSVEELKSAGANLVLKDVSLITHELLKK